MRLCKLLLCIFIGLGITNEAYALGRIQGYVEQGGNTVTTSLFVSSTKVQKSFPGALVTVYLTGTTTTVSLFDVSTGAPIGNPLTADSHGFFQALVASGLYDIKFSGSGITTPWTISGVRVSAFSDVIDVKDFGAKCDGVTDDTTAINSALTAAMALSGATVQFPAANCIVSTLTNINVKGVLIKGAGVGATKIITNATTGDVFWFGNPGVPFNECGGIEDLTIQSNVTRTNGYAIRIDGCEQGIINNIKLATTGGNGIDFGRTGGLATIWFVENSDIEINGSFIGIRTVHGIERHFNNLWLRGTSAVGSRGVQILGDGADWWTDVDVVAFEIGILVDSASNDISWLHMENVLSDTNTLYGFQFTGANIINGTDLLSCWSSSNGPSTLNGRGFLINTANGLLIQSSRVLNNGGPGIELNSGVSNVEISGGFMSGNSIGSVGATHGILMTGTSNVRIHGVRSGQTGIVATGNSQGFGIAVSGTGNTNYAIYGNDVSNNISGGIFNGDAPNQTTTKRIYNNIGSLVDAEMMFLPTSTFANLGAPSNSAITYCSDCNIANPCTGGGTGAVAKRINGAWVCN